MGGMKHQMVDRSEQVMAAPRLGQLNERGLDVFCWCNRCGHNAVIQTDDLIRKLGPALPVPEVGARMRCSVCESKDVATRPAWPSRGAITRHHEALRIDPENPQDRAVRIDTGA